MLPGERLPSERELARRLEVSRPTIREAVRSLAHTGYLESRRGRNGGIYVLEWAPEPSEDRAQELAKKMGSELLDALDVRQVIEPGVAALAAERATPEHLDRLEEALSVLAAAPRDELSAVGRRTVEASKDDAWIRRPLTYRDADRRFHRLIAEISGSPSLVEAVTEIQLRIGDLVMLTPQLQGALRHSDQQHLAIVEAIREGDARVAREHMEEHVCATASYIRGFVER